MGKPYPLELRERAVAFLEAGHSHRATAKRLDTSVKFVNDMIKLKRETGSLAAKPQGNQGQQSKLNPLGKWVDARMKAKPDLTL